MRKKLSFLSGLAAAIIILYPFATNTYADGLTTTSSTGTTSITGTDPSTTGTSAVSEPTSGTSGTATDSSTVTVPTSSAAGTSATTEPASSTAGTSAVTEPAPSTADTSAVTEPAPSTADTSAVTKPAPSTADTSASSIDPAAIDQTDLAALTDPTDLTDSTDGTVSGDVNGTDGSGDNSQDFYFDVPDVSSATQTNDGLTFDYSTHSESFFDLIFSFSTEDISSLKRNNPDPKLIVNKNDVSASLPLNLLPTDPKYGGFEFSIIKDSQTYENAISPVYNFSILYFDPQNFSLVNFEPSFVNDFSSDPVQLTFKIDPSKVKNWNDVKVKYVDDNGVVQDEPIQIVSMDKTTGEIVAKVTHFSEYGEYGVFEIPSSANSGSSNDNGTSTGTTTDGNGTGTTTDGGTTGTSTDGNTSGTTTDGSTTGTSTDGNTSDSTTGDVYGTDVTDDVYQDAPLMSGGTLSDNGVSFDYSDQSASSLSLDLNLTSDDVQTLKEASQNPYVTVNKGNIQVSLPLNSLPIDPTDPGSVLPFGINITQDSQTYANELSPVYDFSIPYTDPQSGTDQLLHNFSDPVLLTFTIDPAKVKNWDNVQVKYIDDKGVIQSEPIQIVSMDKTTGKIVAKVTHFSKYGVFETASADNSGGTSPTGTTNSGTTSTQTTSNTTNSGNTAGSTATTNSAASGSSTNSTAATGTLPVTASNDYNFLMMGLALIVFGGILFSIRYRKTGQTK